MNLSRAITAASLSVTAAAAMSLCGPSAAHADLVTAVITADNHYALYTTGPGNTISFVGRNEVGGGGSPGTYNWSRPETWNFSATQYIYIAVWSDNSTAQGLLADITIGGTPFNSGNPAWQVFATNIDLNSNSPAPSAANLTTQVNLATTNNLWEVPFVGGTNGIAPWGTVPGIASSTNWTWRNTPGDPNPLTPGSGVGEYLIFQIPVPAPGAAAMLGLGGLLVSRRRR